MKREIWWSAIESTGLEHLQVTENPSGVVAESCVMQLEGEKPFHLNYRLECDSDWKVRLVKVALAGDAAKEIVLHADGRGHWTDESGKQISEFENCFEVDISATPLTNTLPIRRLRLEKGQSADISVVYFLIPEMTVQRSAQRYTYLAEGFYKFEEKGVFDGFSADLKVDENGFVIDYPQLFKRIC